MVDYAKEYGIDLDALMTESFAHPHAQWQNACIRAAGERFWEWYAHANPVPPTEEPAPVSVKKVRRVQARRTYEFTDAQLAIAMRSFSVTR